MKISKYTVREVVALLNRGEGGIYEMLKNKARLKDVQLQFILALAVECLGDGTSPNACTGSRVENP